MPGKRKGSTQAIVDGLLKFLVTGGVVTTALGAPNAIQIFDKPLDKFFKNMDKRSRQRELRRIVYYMKQRGLIVYNPQNYEHGIQPTKAGKEYLKKRLARPRIEVPQKWDRKWRLVFFDIPENQKQKRQALTSQLRRLGFQPLQYSIWVHPFGCRGVIETITQTIDVASFVTYVEIDQIDSQKELEDRFTKLLAKI